MEEEADVSQECTRRSRHGDPMDWDVSTSVPKPPVGSGQAVEIDREPNRTQPPVPPPKRHEEERGNIQPQPVQTSWWPRSRRGEDDYHRLKSDLEKKRNDLSAREVELQTCQATLRMVEANEADNRRGIQILQKENFNLRERLKFFEEEIKRSQEKSIREMTDGRWGPVPDDMLRDRLNILHRDIRDWARKWVGGPLELDTLPSETRRDFVQTYLSRVVPVTEGRLPASIEMPTSKMKEKLPLLLLTGVLAYEVQSQFFGNPFFCFKEGCDSVLAETYEELIEGLEFSQTTFAAN
jgi:hypothetical protein